jgi:hypothetical protein
MNFAYSSLISRCPDTDDFLLIRRPEIPVTIEEPAGSATYAGMVDSGSDNTILPRSIADLLGIEVERASGPAAIAFGGRRIPLLAGEAILHLSRDGESLRWKAPVCFFEFPQDDEESVLLGHAGFLEYFTATFDGKLCILTLIANHEMPLTF